MLLLLPLPPSAAAAGAAPPSSSCWPLPPQFRPSRLLCSSLSSPIAAAAAGSSRLLSALPRRQRGRLLEDPITTGFSDDEKEDEMEVEEDEGWLERQPTGFGVGKTYDTAMEEQLLREMGVGRSKTRKDKNKKKDVPAKRNPAAAAAKADEYVSKSSICVRIWNLPKKKNIHRDLQLAFKGFPGLINVNPVVSANKKTRDPICKGFAFLVMESVEAATRFIELYSKNMVPFGKVQKQISCCIVDPPNSVDSSNQASGIQTLCQPEMDLQNGVTASSRNNNVARTSEISFDGSVDATLNDELKEALLVNGGRPLSDLEFVNTGAKQMTIVISDGLEGDSKTEVSKGLMLSSKGETKEVTSKKKRSKPKQAKESNLSLPGSISRLKFKEKTILTGVYSKYSGKAAVSLAKEG